MIWVALCAQPGLSDPPKTAESVSVEIVDSAALAKNKNPELEKFLKATNQVALDTSLHPELKAFQQKLKPFIENLITGEDFKDGTRKIHVVLVDDMSVNASFFKLNGSEHVISLNLGMLNFIENDDQLAFVLGHELEHGPSELQAQIERMVKDRSGAGTIKLLQRSVENEVDIKSALYRLHRKGYNPHAALQWLGNVRKNFGDNGGATHTDTSSRKDTVGMALTYLKRAGGENIKEDIPSQYSSAVLGPLKNGFLSRPVFLEMQKARAIQAMNFSSNPAIEIYRKVKAGIEAPASRGPGPQGDTYSSQAEKHMTQLRRYTEGLVDSREWLDLQLKLHEKLDRAFEEARVSELGEKFRPQTSEKLDALINADYRDFKLDRPNILRVRGEILDIEKDLAESSQAKQTEESTALKATIEKRLLNARERYELAKSTYNTDEQFDELVNKIVVLSKVKVPQNAESRSKDRQTLSMERELEAKQKITGPLLARVRERQNAALNGSVGIILKGFEHPLAFSGSYQHSVGDKLEKFLRLPPELVRPNTQKAWRAFMRGAESYLKRKGTTKMVLIKFQHSQLSATQLFRSYYEANPRDATNDLKRLVSAMITEAPDLESLQLIVESIRPNRDGSNPTLSVSDGGLSLDPELAAKVLTPEMREQYLLRFSKLATAKITRSSPKEAAEIFNEYLFRIKALGSSSSIQSSIEIMTRLASAQTQKDFFGRFGSAPDLEMARSILFGRSPELLERAIQSGKFDIIQFETHLNSISKIVSQTNKPLDPPILFFEMAHTLFKYQSKESVFRMLAGVSSALDYKYAGPNLNKSDPDFLTHTALEYQEWIRANAPDRLDLLVRMNSHWYSNFPANKALQEKFKETSARFYQERFRYHLEKNKSQPLRKRMEQATFDFWSEFKPWAATTHFGSYELIEKQLPVTSNERLDAYNGYVDGIRRLNLEKPFIVTVPREGEKNYYLDKVYPHWIQGLLSDVGLRAQADLGKLTDAALTVFEVSGASEKNDLLFEYIWKKSEKRPDIRARFMKEAFIQKLFFDENRKILARWQLNEKHGIDGFALALKSRKAIYPKKNEMRQIISDLRKMIDTQFVRDSAVKNEIIEYVENALVTNEKETRFLDQGRVGLKNWYESRNLAALDAPQKISGGLKTNLDRLELLEYLIGTRTAQPAFVDRDLGKSDYSMVVQNKDKIKEKLANSKRFFASSDVHTRTYILQPLLDSKRGILSEAPVREKMNNLILGEHADNRVIREIFAAYVESVPESERKVILGQILGSFADAKRKTASLKVVLEAMGPFGIKVGQFLRTSGLVGPEYRVELDHFLSHAAPPRRDQIIPRFQDIFGKKLAYVHAVEELAGSGSINYFVRASIYNPKTRKKENVGVRIMRDAVEGQVQNENQIWEKAIERLSKSTDPETQRHSRTLDEARVQAYETLKRGGIELDLEVERKAFPAAQRVYSTPADLASGYRIEVSQPVSEIQALVPAALSKEVSIYRYVAHTPIDQIQSPALRAQLAQQIVKAELSALFQKGTFDPDGHPGNWLVDTEGKRLVRIDYAQMRTLLPEDLNAVRGVLTALIDPSMGGDSVDLLTEHFEATFAVGEKVVGLREVIRKIVRSPEFPDFSTPHERLFFLREKLEGALQAKTGRVIPVRLKDGIRSAFASLARTQIYREHMDDQTYLRALVDALDLDIKRFSVQVMKHKLIKSVSGKVRKAAREFSSCLGRFLGALQAE